MDTFAIVDEHGAVCYGGIDQFQLLDSALELHLTAESAQALGAEATLEIRFPKLDRLHLRRMRAAVRAVLRTVDETAVQLHQATSHVSTQGRDGLRPS